MSEEPSVRPVTPADIEAIIDVISEHVLDDKAEDRRPIIRRACKNDHTSGGVVAEDSGGVVGCMIYTLHNGTETPDTHFARSIPHDTNDDFAIIRYAYLRQAKMGKGHGTRMMNRVLDTLRELEQVDAVYVEAWHRPDTLDMRPLLDKYDFSTVFASEDYWAHPEYDGNNITCSDCGIPHYECRCGGGIYRLEL